MLQIFYMKGGPKMMPYPIIAVIFSLLFFQSQLLHAEEGLQLQNETQLATFRKKHQEVQNEFADQLDQLHKAKQKYFVVHYALEKQAYNFKMSVDNVVCSIWCATK